MQAHRDRSFGARALGPTTTSLREATWDFVPGYRRAPLPGLGAHAPCLVVSTGDALLYNWRYRNSSMSARTNSSLQRGEIALTHPVGA